MRRHVFLYRAGVAIVIALLRAPNARAQQTNTTDKPVGVTACQLAALQKAIEPSVAEARRTWPVARAKFVDRSAPRRPMFITMVLHDTLGQSEQVFVRADSVTSSKVFGRIANPLNVVRGYTFNQPIAFGEAELLDWMFQNADGSEEGNVVGKFLDTYAPPRCI